MDTNNRYTFFMTIGIIINLFTCRYYELVAIHGELQPLLDVKFKPATRIKLRVCYADNIFERHINVYQTTNELKVRISPLQGRQYYFFA